MAVGAIDDGRSQIALDAGYLAENNYRYTRILCEACLRDGVRFIAASSAATYGDGEKGYSDDDDVTPTLVPGINGCDGKPLSLPVPTLDTLRSYGFSMTYEIKPNVILEQGRIFKAAGSKRIFPKKHFPILIGYMKKDAIRRGYKYDE